MSINPYLDRLRGQIHEKQHPQQPSKPSKPAFESFEGDQGSHFSGNERAESAKNTTPTCPQNPQNLGSPSAAYQAASAEPNGTACKVEIVELPQAQRYRKVFGVLQLRPPALVPIECWRQCVQDGSKFLAQWGSQAEALGWSSADLFGLIEIPKCPSPSFNRLRRYDRLGLCWALEGREVNRLDR
jgi:hypothetical protein